MRGQRFRDGYADLTTKRVGVSKVDDESDRVPSEASPPGEGPGVRIRRADWSGGV